MKSTQDQQSKIFFLVKGSIDEDIKSYSEVKLNLDNLSKEQASILIDTLYELEQEWDKSDDGEETPEYKKLKFQVLATLESIR